MSIAEEVQQVGPGLWFWQSYEPTVKTELSCCAVESPAGLVFIDPIPLTPEALDEICAQSKPAAIILTNGNHDRAAETFGKKFRVPIFAHAEAREALALKSEPITNCTSLFNNCFTIVELPGFGPGEIALHSPTHGGRLFLGDALINLGSTGFTPLPAKYCTSPKLARTSLQKLLQFDFELMTFAHGLPIVTHARQRLETLIA